jgi:hypothetical protein
MMTQAAVAAATKATQEMLAPLLANLAPKQPEVVVPSYQMPQAFDGIDPTILSQLEPSTRALFEAQHNNALKMADIARQQAFNELTKANQDNASWRAQLEQRVSGASSMSIDATAASLVPELQSVIGKDWYEGYMDTPDLLIGGMTPRQLLRTSKDSQTPEVYANTLRAHIANASSKNGGQPLTPQQVIARNATPTMSHANPSNPPDSGSQQSQVSQAKIMQAKAEALNIRNPNERAARLEKLNNIERQAKLEKRLVL